MTEEATPLQDVPLHVRDLSGGRSARATVAPDAPVASAYAALAARFGYDGASAGPSGAGGAGVRAGMAIFHVRARALLSPEITFGAAGVKPGDTLVLVPIALEEGAR